MANHQHQRPTLGGAIRVELLAGGDVEQTWTLAKDEVQTLLERALADPERGLAGRLLVIVEIGAGTAIPSVRHFCERMRRLNGTLIRINPREPSGPSGTVSLAMGGAAALQAIQERL